MRDEGAARDLLRAEVGRDEDLDERRRRARAARVAAGDRPCGDRAGVRTGDAPAGYARLDHSDSALPETVSDGHFILSFDVPPHLIFRGLVASLNTSAVPSFAPAPFLIQSSGQGCFSWATRSPMHHQPRDDYMCFSPPKIS